MKDKYVIGHIDSTVIPNQKPAKGELLNEAVNPTRQHAKKCPKLYGQECTCDGYHTFEELYEHRITLYIALCKTMAGKRYFNSSGNSQLGVWRAPKHSDGTTQDRWFVLGIFSEPGKQITYHVPISRWEECYFAKDLEKAPEFDGHTSEDVLERIKQL